MDFKVNIIENDTEANRLLNKLLVSPIREKFVEIGKEKFVMPIYFKDNWEKVNKFEIRDDDVLVAGHMRNGTTWLTEIVDLIVSGVHSKDTNTLRIERQKFIEWPLMYNSEILNLEYPYLANSLNDLKDMKDQRCLRTHLPWPLLPEQIRNGTRSPKIFHIRRNPMDTCISFYHHSRAIDAYRGTFEEFCRLFLAGKLQYGPFFANVKSYWEQRNRSNVLLLTYTDLREDLPGMIRKIANFLEKPLSENEVQDLVEYVSIDSMRKHLGKELNDFIDKFAKTHYNCVQHSEFVRECKDGGYKSVISEELIQEFDKYTKDELLGTELCF